MSRREFIESVSRFCDRKEAAAIANDYTDKGIEEYGSELVSELAEDYRFNANVNRYRNCGY